MAGLPPVVTVPSDLFPRFEGLAQLPTHYIGNAQKLNRKGKLVRQVFIVTTDATFSCDHKGGVNRCIHTNRIAHLLLSPEKDQIALKVPTEYDLLIKSKDSELIANLLQQIYHVITNRQLPLTISKQPIESELQLERPRNFSIELPHKAEYAACLSRNAASDSDDDTKKSLIERVNSRGLEQGPPPVIDRTSLHLQIQAKQLDALHRTLLKESSTRVTDGHKLTPAQEEELLFIQQMTLQVQQQMQQNAHAIQQQFESVMAHIKKTEGRAIPPSAQVRTSWRAADGSNFEAIDATRSILERIESQQKDCISQIEKERTMLEEFTKELETHSKQELYVQNLAKNELKELESKFESQRQSLQQESQALKALLQRICDQPRGGSLPIPTPPSPTHTSPSASPSSSALLSSLNFFQAQTKSQDSRASLSIPLPPDGSMITQLREMEDVFQKKMEAAKELLNAEMDRYKERTSEWAVLNKIRLIADSVEDKVRKQDSILTLMKEQQKSTTQTTEKRLEELLKEYEQRETTLTKELEKEKIALAMLKRERELDLQVRDEHNKNHETSVLQLAEAKRQAECEIAVLMEKIKMKDSQIHDRDQQLSQWRERGRLLMEEINIAHAKSTSEIQSLQTQLQATQTKLQEQEQNFTVLRQHWENESAKLHAELERVNRQVEVLHNEKTELLEREKEALLRLELHKEREREREELRRLEKEEEERRMERRKLSQPENNYRLEIPVENKLSPPSYQSHVSPPTSPLTLTPNLNHKFTSNTTVSPAQRDPTINQLMARMSMLQSKLSHLEKLETPVSPLNH